MNNNIAISIIIAAALIIYKIFFVVPVDDSIPITSAKIDQALIMIDSINFDRQVFSDPNLGSLKSLEIPINEVSVGKSNPFGSIIK